MKFGTQFVAVVVVFAALACTVWVGRGTSVVTAPTADEDPQASGIPEPAKSGPYPKAVAEETSYDFGTMVYKTKGEHEFEIRNEGEAPLELVARKEDTTCQCTFGSLDNGQLPPGESTLVKVSWEIKNPSPRFQHSAIVRTNDPENREIRLIVKGNVGKVLTSSPGETWRFDLIPEGRPAEFTGLVFSEVVDEFKILKIEDQNELLTTVVTPMTAERLKKLHEKKERDAAVESVEAPPVSEEEEQERKARPGIPKPLCGYEVKVSLAVGTPVGSFREQLRIVTDLEEPSELTVYVEGHRPGPLEFFSSPGTNWLASNMQVRLGKFAAVDGTKGLLTMYITRADEPVEITGIESSLDYLTVKFERDESYKGTNRERFKVHFEIPPNSPPIARSGTDAVKVLVKTNHPAAPTIPLNVSLLSY